MPAPTAEPTTIAVRAHGDSFCSALAIIAQTPRPTNMGIIRAGADADQL